MRATCLATTATGFVVRTRRTDPVVGRRREIAVPDTVRHAHIWAICRRLGAGDVPRGPISARILAALLRGSERFVEHLNRTGRVTTTEAIELLGVSRPTAIRHLQHLVDAGFREAVRKSPNDPRGYWRTFVGGS